jgi:hypothetical protein
MSVLEWYKSQASVGWAIDAPRSQNPAYPVCAAGFADLETNEDLWAVLLTDFQQVDRNNSCSEQRNIGTTSDTSKGFLVLPALERFDGVPLIRQAYPCCIVLVKDLQDKLLGSRVNSRPTVEHEAVGRQAHTTLCEVLDTRTILRRL